MAFGATNMGAGGAGTFVTASPTAGANNCLRHPDSLLILSGTGLASSSGCLRYDPSAPGQVVLPNGLGGGADSFRRFPVSSGFGDAASGLSYLILDAQGGTVLGATAANSGAAATANTGVLTTADPAANQHGLPLNFGRGRGNWREEDTHRIRVDARAQVVGAAAGTAASPAGQLSVIVTHSSNNLTFTFINQNNLALERLWVAIHFMASLTYR